MSKILIKKPFKNLAHNSPKNSRRGCLCKDGKTYHVDCCDGTLHAQGIGKIRAS